LKTEPNAMINNETELRKLLAGTFLAHADIAPLDVLDTGETAIAIDISAAEPFQSWTLLRELTQTTGRWPLLVTCWSGEDNFREKLSQADLFSRFYFREEPMRGDRRSDHPAEIVAASISVDTELELDRISRRDVPDLEYVNLLVEGTQARFGTAPDIADPAAFLLDERINSLADLEH
jgi:hypothetical protein